MYEDKSNVCLAMEVCNGGELFDAIVKKGHYTEKDAAGLIRTIVGVVAHCHNMGVIHRDLKVRRPPPPPWPRGGIWPAPACSGAAGPTPHGAGCSAAPCIQQPREMVIC